MLACHNGLTNHSSKDTHWIYYALHKQDNIKDYHGKQIFSNLNFFNNDSKWPPGGHFFPELLIFFYIYLRKYCTLSIHSSSKWGILRYYKSYEDIRKVLRFKMAAWRPVFPELLKFFLHISPKVFHIEYPFQFQMGGIEV